MLFIDYNRIFDDMGCDEMEKSYSLTGTKTEMNLARAFAGETQARTKYLFYADTANEEGYPTLQQIFLETSDNERGHAEIIYDYLTEGLPKTAVNVDTSVAVQLGNTAQNLLAASEGEYYEWTKLYPMFASIAEEEGFHDIAVTFHEITTIEKRHDERFTHLLEQLNQNTLYSSPIETLWICTNCGLYLRQKNAPAICPSCHHPQSFFMNINDQLYPYRQQ